MLWNDISLPQLARLDVDVPAIPAVDVLRFVALALVLSALVTVIAGAPDVSTSITVCCCVCACGGLSGRGLSGLMSMVRMFVSPGLTGLVGLGPGGGYRGGGMRVVMFRFTWFCGFEGG